MLYHYHSHSKDFGGHKHIAPAQSKKLRPKNGFTSLAQWTRPIKFMTVPRKNTAQQQANCMGMVTYNYCIFATPRVPEQLSIHADDQSWAWRKKNVKVIYGFHVGKCHTSVILHKTRGSAFTSCYWGSFQTVGWSPGLTCNFVGPHLYTHEHNVPSVQCLWQDTAKRLWWKVWVQPDQFTEGENNVKQNFWPNTETC